MIVATLVLLIPLARGSVASSPDPLQSPRDVPCREWRDCRQLALAAAERGEYEAFHDLAWRAVQTGPPKDPALMYLLARAQSLSGRPHDALVMLRRLAEMGVASDAGTHEDFSRMRQLPEWPEVAARIERIAGPKLLSASAASRSPSSPAAPVAPGVPSPAAAPVAPSAAAAPIAPSAPSPAAVPIAPSAPSPAPAPAVSGAPSAPAAPAARPSVVTAGLATEAVRFSAERFAVGGLAYDAVSHRFVFGDRQGRKLIVVGEGSNHAVDLVRADSAGFQEISAIEIDARRGDLWVASAAAPDGAGMLHRLQLVSGRQLRSFRVAADPEAVKLVDLAVSPAGAVLVLDAVSRQLLVLRSGGTSLERVMRIDAQEPASLAAGGDEGIAYVAHRDGVSRIDLRARTASRVAAPKAISIAHLERIRWYRNALIAVQVDGDGSRRIVRLALNASGLAVTKATPLEVPGPVDGQTFVTISGDELVYLPAGSGVASAPADASSSLAEFVAYRVRLR